MKQPAGNIAISCFPKIIDCYDILETFVYCWYDDVIGTLGTAEKKNYKLMEDRAEDYIQKLYPVLFSVDFDLKANETISVIGEPGKVETRQGLVLSALRYGSKKGGGTKPKRPIQDLTTFKPFNVREIEFSFWDQSNVITNEIMSRKVSKNRTASHPPMSGNRYR